MDFNSLSEYLIKQKKSVLIAVVSVCLVIDQSLQLLTLILNILYPCYQTYVCLTNGQDNQKWTRYWIIYGITRLIEKIFITVLLYITFGFYYYIKIIGLTLLTEKEEFANKIFDYIQKVLMENNVYSRFQDVEQQISQFFKTIKSGNKRSILIQNQSE